MTKTKIDMKEIKSDSVLILLMAISFCSCFNRNLKNSSLNTEFYPDFEIVVEQKPFYPDCIKIPDDTYIIKKIGNVVYLQNKIIKGDCNIKRKYTIELLDSIHHSFQLIEPFKKKMKLSSNWSYSSQPPKYKSSILLNINFINSDSVLCTITHLPDTSYYSFKTSGTIKFFNRNN